MGPLVGGLRGAVSWCLEVGVGDPLERIRQRVLSARNPERCTELLPRRGGRHGNRRCRAGAIRDRGDRDPSDDERQEREPAPGDSSMLTLAWHGGRLIAWGSARWRTAVASIAALPRGVGSICVLKDAPPSASSSNGSRSALAEAACRLRGSVSPGVARACPVESWGASCTLRSRRLPGVRAGLGFAAPPRRRRARRSRRTLAPRLDGAGLAWGARRRGRAGLCTPPDCRGAGRARLGRS